MIHTRKILSTRDNKQYRLPEDLADVAVLYDDATFLVNESMFRDQNVRSVRNKYEELLGATITMVKADLDTIRKAYKAEDELEDAPQISQEDTSKMQELAMSIFLDASKQFASDIHIRVGEHDTKIFFRVNSDLTKYKEIARAQGMSLLMSLYNSMTEAGTAATNWKESAKLGARISDPKFLPKGLFGLRVQKSSMVGGQVMVMRLLYVNESSSDLSQLGLLHTQIDQIHMMMAQPYGINIISGPTGSGKSTTLQRVLADLVARDEGKSNIMTVEDPPEYLIPGAVQTPVVAEKEEERGPAFREAISSIMRMDPDTIMIGEIRDKASAGLAVEAAMTGHTVFSTLHANNSFAIVDRLADLGLSRNLLCDPQLITGLIAQRLCKKLCPHCKQPITPTSLPHDVYRRTFAALNGDLTNVHVMGEGCKECNETGIAGRIAVCEIVIPDEHMFELLREEKKSQAIRYWREEQGGMNMLAVAIYNVQQGLVDPRHAEKVAGLLTTNMMNADSKLSAEEMSSNMRNPTIAITNTLVQAPMKWGEEDDISSENLLDSLPATALGGNIVRLELPEEIWQETAA